MAGLRKLFAAAGVLAFVVCISSSKAALIARLDFNLSTQLFRVLPSYVSVNIDSGSLFNDFDFTSV